MLFGLPIPYFVFGPGKAVDLSTVLVVPGYEPPRGQVLLTDVSVLPSRPAYYAVAKIVPGFEVVPRERFAPPSTSDKQLEAQLVDAMRESQLVAQVVAERAAGMRVWATHAFVVVGRVARTPGARCFQLGDTIVALNGRALTRPSALADAAAGAPVGARFAFSVRRGKSAIHLSCTTAIVGGKHRFGIRVEVKTEIYRLPVRVAYHVRDINGSSAGLMFALQIYRTLTGRELAHGATIAGTGVLGFDGSVSEVGGVEEKIRSARRAGATIFVVPKANYGTVRSTAAIRILPVSSFAAAVRALQYP